MLNTKSILTIYTFLLLLPSLTFAKEYSHSDREDKKIRSIFMVFIGNVHSLQKLVT